MNVFKNKLLGNLMARAIEQAIKDARYKIFSAGMLVTHIDDTSVVYEIQSIDKKIATVAPCNQFRLDKKNCLALPVKELIEINNILMHFVKNSEEFEKSKKVKEPR